MQISLNERIAGSLFQLHGLQEGNCDQFIKEFEFEQLPDIGKSVATSLAVLMWNGPGMWMLECKLDSPDRTAKKLTKIFDTTEISIVDLSSARTIIQVTGKMASRLIKKGSPVDIDSLEVNSVVSTLIGHTSVLIHYHDELSYDIYVMQTFGTDFWHWCAYNAAEFGFKR